MEHIEQAGVHSGDSACSLPPYSLSPELQDELRRQTVALAKALDVVGLMNVQFAIQDGVVYVLEVNPRASRTVPYVSKATGRPLAKIAARCMAGTTLDEQGVDGEIVPPYYSVKEAVFPFIKFPGVDTILGPEMKSTGEVMGVGETFGEAFVKSQLAAGVRLPDKGKVFVSVKNSDKPRAVETARMLHELGFQIVATRGTAAALAAAGVPVDRGEQGRRGPAAHRRHDQERRDRDGVQHGRGEAQRDPRQLRDPPRGAVRRGADVHDGRRASAPRRSACRAMRDARRCTPASIQSLHRAGWRDRSDAGARGMSTFPMTVEGAERLKAELQRLKSVERPAVIQAIAEARSHGDLSENADYDAAKERQGFIEGRIAEIENKLAGAQVIDPRDDRRRRPRRVRRDRRDRGRRDRRAAPLADRRRRRGRHQARTRSRCPRRSPAR